MLLRFLGIHLAVLCVFEQAYTQARRKYTVRDHPLTADQKGTVFGFVSTQRCVGKSSNHFAFHEHVLLDDDPVHFE